MADSFEDLSLQTLYQRRNAKWRLFPNDVLPSFLAEMDFPLSS